MVQVVGAVVGAVAGAVVDEPASTRPRAPATRRCRWCGRPFTANAGPGRPREFCRRSCRQRDFEARRRSRELGLSEADVVVARAELDELRDHLWVLEQTVHDVERDLAAARTARELRDALEWLLHAARPLLALQR